jgi:hypothetical protein
LPPGADHARTSGIHVPEFPEPTVLIVRIMANGQD